MFRWITSKSHILTDLEFKHRQTSPDKQNLYIPAGAAWFLQNNTAKQRLHHFPHWQEGGEGRRDGRVWGSIRGGGQYGRRRRQLFTVYCCLQCLWWYLRRLPNKLIWNSFHVNVALSVLIDLTFSLYQIRFSLFWLFHLFTPTKSCAAWEPLKTNPLGGPLVPKALLSKSTFATQKHFPLLWLHLAMVYFGSTHINHLKIASLFFVRGKHLPSIFLGLWRCLPMLYITITGACGLNVFEDLPCLLWLIHQPLHRTGKCFTQTPTFGKHLHRCDAPVCFGVTFSPPPLIKVAPPVHFIYFMV